MTYETLRLIVWVIGLPIIVYLVWRIIVRVREINVLDAKVREEEEEIAKNPYAAYARMMEVQQLMEEARGKRRPERREKSEER